VLLQEIKVELVGPYLVSGDAVGRNKLSSVTKQRHLIVFHGWACRVINAVTQETRTVGGGGGRQIKICLNIFWLALISRLPKYDVGYMVSYQLLSKPIFVLSKRVSE